MKTNDKENFTVHEPLEIDCPFCLGKYIVDTAEGAEPAVFHTMPPCKTFLDHEIQDFLKLARRTLAPETFD